MLPYCGVEFRIGTAGVDLFFVISGFVMVYASEKYFGQPHGSRDFMVRRLARIVPIYRVTTTLALVLLIVWQRDANGFVLSPASIAASYLFIPYERSNGFAYPVHSVGWTLQYEMFFYVCFSLVLFFRRRIAVTVLALPFMGFIVLNKTTSLRMPFSYWMDPTLLEFVAGTVVGSALRDGFRLSKGVAATLAIAAVAALIIMGIFLQVTPVVAFGVPTVMMVTACALGFGNLACTGLPCRVAVFLGEASSCIHSRSICRVR